LDLGGNDLGFFNGRGGWCYYADPVAYKNFSHRDMARTREREGEEKWTMK